MDAPDALSPVLRAISFALVLNSAGIVLFIALLGRYLPGRLQAIARIGWKLALAALVAVVAHHLLEAARMTGEMSGALDGGMQMMALRSSEGAGFVVRVAGVLLIATGLLLACPVPLPALAQDSGLIQTSGLVRGRWLAVALSGVAAAIVSFTLTGHTSVAPHRLATAALLVVHLLIVAFWIGSLWPLYLAAGTAAGTAPGAAGAAGAATAGADTATGVAGAAIGAAGAAIGAAGTATRAEVARLIDAFSRVAAALVPVILLAGVGLAMLLIPDLSVLKQPYGQLLLAKVALFAVLMALAALNKWQFGPACEAGDTKAFRRSVVLEYVLICGVLTVTAVMTTFYSPAEP